MKGVSIVISAILIIGLYATITIVTLQWGMPMVAKNQDISTIDKAESFLYQLDKKIGRVAKLEGNEEIEFNLPGKIYVEPNNNRIRFYLNTKGYKNYPKNYTCISDNCDTSINSSEADSLFVLKARLRKHRNAAITEYLLKPITIKRGDDLYTLNISHSGKGVLIGGKGSNILIRTSGKNIKSSSDPDIDKEIKTKIDISIRDI